MKAQQAGAGERRCLPSQMNRFNATRIPAFLCRCAVNKPSQLLKNEAVLVKLRECVCFVTLHLCRQSPAMFVI